MKIDKKLSRRRALQAGLGAVAMIASQGARGGQATPAQAEGPFYPTHEQLDRDADLTQLEDREGTAQGEVIIVAGIVVDDSDQPVPEALVDVWQANAAGRYDHEADPNPAPLDPNFQGWAQLRADEAGRFSFKTIKPGAYQVDNVWTRPPHIHFKVSRRGYRELITQMYFAGDPRNDVDQLLQELTPEQQQQLVVTFSASGGGIPSGEFRIVLPRVTARA